VFLTKVYKTNSNLLQNVLKMGQGDKVECTVCGGIFGIDHGGKSDINQHIKTNRHQLTSNAKNPKK